MMKKQPLMTEPTIPHKEGLAMKRTSSGFAGASDFVFPIAVSVLRGSKKQCKSPVKNLCSSCPFVAEISLSILLSCLIFCFEFCILVI